MPNFPPFPPDACRPIEILAFPDVQLLDVAGPLQVFASVNDCLAREGAAPPYAPSVVAAGGAIVAASAGLGLVAAPLSPANAALDTLLVAGGPGVDRAAGDGELLGWVREKAAHARRVTSVCTGAFLLGAAGLLEGRRVVTHWTRCADLARRFPTIRVEADPIFINDGPIWTSAGITAGIDLALALVEQDLGQGIALAVARHLVVFLKRPGGQAQFSAMLTLQRAEARFAALHDWIAVSAAIMPLPAALPRPAWSSVCGSRRRVVCCPRRGCQQNVSPSAAASAPKRPCAAVLPGYSRARRRITAPGSASDWLDGAPGRRGLHQGEKFG
jgi:transcriptional regulator GlxA family with amidase domain